MTQYLNKTFTVGMPSGKEYRDNWNRVFGHSSSDRAAKEKYYKSTKGKALVQNRKFKEYGVDQEWFDKTLALQGGRCAICKRTEPGGKGTWHIDHSHSNNSTRGLLCQRCNMFLGLAGDSFETLRSAAEYLEQWDRIFGKDAGDIPSTDKGAFCCCDAAAGLECLPECLADQQLL